jgi:hypothetical protein
MAAYMRYLNSRVAQLGLQQITIGDLTWPFHDCSFDAVHFGWALPEEQAREKLLPWVCGL